MVLLQHATQLESSIYGDWLRGGLRGSTLRLMRTLSFRVGVASAAYVVVAQTLFVGFRWWDGGVGWGESVLHDVRVISNQHHFVPPWTRAFLVAMTCAVAVTCVALGFAGRRAVRPVLGLWAAVFTGIGVLMAAIPRLSIIATEPGSMGLGHIAHVAAALVFLGFVLTLRCVVPQLFRSSKQRS